MKTLQLGVVTLSALSLMTEVTNAVEDAPETTFSDNTSNVMPETTGANWYQVDENTCKNSDFFKTYNLDDENKTCSGDKQAPPFRRDLFGTNLGGLFVLEAWITPSLFFQFLGTTERCGEKASEKTGLDSYTFCVALGAEEGNKQLRKHWANWITEDDIAAVAKAGVNSLRIPVGDWMFIAYGPHIGCTDGAVEELDRILDLLHKYKLTALLDIHGMIGSQNGFDNSGMSSAVEWNMDPSTKYDFMHWDIQEANWVGEYNRTSNTYTSINYKHLNYSLKVVETIVARYANHPAVVGLESANEPWQNTPLDILKEYYWQAYKFVKCNTNWFYLFHDSFRFSVDIWSPFMHGCPDVAIDTHIYQVWQTLTSRADYYSNACQQKNSLRAMENASLPVVVGEWSVATDNCVMWLNGFNDNLRNYPKVKCRYINCPVDNTYLGQGFPGTPLDVNKPLQGPYGTGESGPIYGKCPVSSNTSFGQTSEAAELDLMRQLLLKYLNAWRSASGFYFWTIKTELRDTRWDLLDLIRKGIFTADLTDYRTDSEVTNACKAEDAGEFTCVAHRDAPRSDLQNSLTYACNAERVNCDDIETRFSTFIERCDYAFTQYWQAYRGEGATCYFGGVASLQDIPMPLS